MSDGTAKQTGIAVGQLVGDLDKVIAERDELIEALIEMVNQHCTTKRGLLDSLYCGANADAMRLLARLGKVRIIRGDGRDVIAERVEAGEVCEKD